MSKFTRRKRPYWKGKGHAPVYAEFALSHLARTPNATEQVPSRCDVAPPCGSRRATSIHLVQVAPSAPKASHGELAISLDLLNREVRGGHQAPKDQLYVLWLQGARRHLIHHLALQEELLPLVMAHMLRSESLCRQQRRTKQADAEQTTCEAARSMHIAGRPPQHHGERELAQVLPHPDYGPRELARHEHAEAPFKHRKPRLHGRHVDLPPQAA
mmetsp:Transcript_2292/g.5719  ORF Transcript_2292/g.5719 Transcript_2292/m.5719 type:complete len:214 (+) Transcript_2292:57-698(+)